MKEIRIPQAEPKVWGTTAEIAHSRQFSAHRLETLAGGYSSRHWHQSRANRFYVESGRIAVTVWDEHGCERVELKPGDAFDVPSQAVHRFEVLVSGVVWEFYWPDRGGFCERDDIVRLDQGGMGRPTKGV